MPGEEMKETGALRARGRHPNVAAEPRWDIAAPFGGPGELLDACVEDADYLKLYASVTPK